MSSSTMIMPPPPPPPVTADPRFRAGRTLVQTGKAGEGAIAMFATLVEESITKYGESSVEAAACYYEYGNSLFRAASRRAEADVGEGNGGKEAGGKCAANDQEDNSSKPAAIPSASKSASAAEKRAAASVEAGSSPSASGVKRKQPGDGGSEKCGEAGKASASPVKDEEGKKEIEDEEVEEAESAEEEDDVPLALEQMENAYAILENYLNRSGAKDGDSNKTGKSAGKSTAADEGNKSELPYREWAQEQLPRILLGMGDVFSFLGRHADAVDAYTRALPYREEAAERIQALEDTERPTVEQLRRRRLVVEVNVLVAEELLACPEGEDVVTTERESEVILVKASERVDFARGYYDKARDELQEAVYTMGKIASSGDNLSTEKEDVCYLATMVMAVGNALAEIDDQAPSSIDAKKAKTG